MSKYVLALVVFLLPVLSGCGGEEFTRSELIPSGGTGSSTGGPLAGAFSDAGESTGGTENADVGGSATAGSVGTSGSPSEGGMGGTDSTPSGGMAGSPMGGTEAGTGGSAVVQVCNPFATKCTDKVLDTCSQDGTKWTPKTCDFICSSSKGCIGSCTPGDARCEDGKSESCNAEGVWVVTQTCAFACQGAGVCGGSCVPGAKKCDGLVPQVCGLDAEWSSGTACDNVCSAGTCTGSCVPGTKQCNDKVSQTCQGNGTWQNTKTCDFICSGSGTCSGECVPGTKRCSNVFVESCNAQGLWQTDGSCPFTCTNGSCGGVCKPNTNCSDDGNDCTDDVCSSDGLTCNHPAKSNGASCGSSSNTECNKPDSCQSGTCKTNFVASGVACSDDGAPCTADACTGTGQCGHPAGNAGTTCRNASCSNGTLTPEAKCTGAATSCPSTAPVTCYGMCTASGDACAEGATKVADAYTMLATDNDATSIYASVRTQAGVTQILKVSKSTGAQTVLYQDSSPSKWIYALIVAENYIYLGETEWSGSTYTGKVTLISTMGASQFPTIVSSQATFGFAKNTTKVYWTDARQVACDCANPAITHVYSVDIGQSSPTTFPLSFSSLELSPDLEVTDTDIYLWGMGSPVNSTYQPSLIRYNLNTPTMAFTSLIPGYYMDGVNMVNTRATYASLPSLTKNNSYVLANVGSANGTAVLRIQKSDEKSDDALKLLATGLGADPTYNFVASDSTVYVGNQKVSLSGGAPTYTSGHSLAGPSTLTLDSNYLYFGSYGYWTGLPYTGTVDVDAKAFFKVAK